MERLNFTKSSSIFQIIIHKYNFGLMIVGKLVWQQEEVQKGDISIALFFGNNPLPPCSSGNSGSNLIDPTLQDNVVIGSGIFHYIYHVGCAFNLHSIIRNGLVPGG